MVDIVTRAGKGSPLTNNEVDANFTNLAEVAGVTGEPMGHEDRTTSTISFNASTRTFTIAPVSTSFTVWCKGKKVVVSSAQTVTIPNTSGMYSIYYDANGVLAAKAGYFTFSVEAPTAYVYWNAATGTCPYFGDERHGVVLDWQTHEYLHRTRGAALASGFGASGYTLGGNGSSNAHAQLTLEGGTFFDEDMKIIVTATNTPTAGTWEQDLLSPARIPVLYLSGTGWVIDAPTDYPLKQGTSRPQYNALSGGVWSTADVANNKYATSWILATNNLTYPVIAIIGQAESDLQSAAEAVDFTSLQLPGFPSVEFRPLYRLVFQCADSFSNAVKASLVSITDIRSIAAAGVAASLITDHGNLSGLSDDDHPQYLSVDTVRASLTAAVKASFLPSQTGNAGKFLTTDATSTSWAALTSGNITTALGFTPYNATNPAGYITGITSSNVTTALGFTPYNATNPSGYITTAGARGAISVTGAGSYDSATGVINIVGGVTSFNTRTGAITLSSADVTTALGFTPYNSTNPSGYITGITSSMVTTALGFTPYNSTNPSGYITTAGARAAISVTGSGSYDSATGVITVTGGVTSVNTRTGAVTINSTDITTALGFTPYNATNPSGYITSSALSSYLPLSGGTVTGRLITTASASSDNYAGAIRISPIGTEQWGGVSFPDTNAGTSASNNYWFYGRGEAISNRTLTAHIPSYADYFSTGAVPSWGVYRTGAVSLFRVWADGAVTAGGNQVLHAGNYNSYALPLTGGTLSGVLNISNGDNSYVTFGPNTTYSGSLRVGTGVGPFGLISGRATIHSDNGNLKIDAGTGQTLYLNQFNGGGTVYIGGTTNYLLHTGNYNSFAPTLTGGGASGTWGISISGNSATTSQRSFSGDISTTGQGRFTGWYAGGAATGFATEIGVSGGQGYILSYNRDTATYGVLNIAGSASNLQISGSTVNVSSGALQQGGNQVLHAGNYTSYAATAGHNHTYDVNNAWLRDANDDANVKLYGNTRQMVFRTDGTTEFASGVGGYAFAWMYGGDSANERRMLLASDGRLWTNYHGWLDTMSVAYASTAGSADAIDGVGFRNTGSNSGTNADTIESNGITYYTAGVTNFSGNATDGALYSQAYSGNWQHQIAGDYRSGQIALRGKNNGTWQSWRTVLDSSNVSSYAHTISTNPSTAGPGTLAIGNQGSYSFVQSHAGQPLNLNPLGNAVNITGNTAIHAGNYSSYALPLSGGTISGSLTMSGAGNSNSIIFGDSSKRINVESYWMMFKGHENEGFRWQTAGQDGATYTTRMQLTSSVLTLTSNVALDFGPNTTWGATLRVGGNGHGGGSRASVVTTNGNLHLDASNNNGIYLGWYNSGNNGTYFGNGASGQVGRIDGAGNGSFNGRFTVSAWTTTGRNYSNEWIEFGNHSGLYSPINGAHFYPNDQDYGPWRINGSRNGWNGLYFDTGSTLMMNSNEVGFHRTGNGWQMRWQAGTGYVHKGNPGGGTSAAILDASNYTSYSPSLGGSGASGSWGISVTGTAAHLPTLYAGGQQLNPQVYFSSSVGLRVAMTATAGYWSDTLWINGYSGGDVLQMCALHTQRNGQPRMYISNQASNATSYGTLYEFLSTWNYSSYALPLTGGTVSGSTSFTSGSYCTYMYGQGNTAAVAGVGMNVFSNNGAGAIMAFHRGGYYAVNMGLDSDNVMRIGGWSAGANRWQLDMSGNGTYAGNVTAYSDERLKKDWTVLPSDFIAKLATVKSGTYTRIDSGERQAGSSAQDWQTLLPEVVSASNDEAKTLALAYGNAALVSAVELAKEVVDLRNRVAQLESLINKLIGD